ncbi:MAG TPA: glycosyltransferase family 2 protein [Syntrophorhabdales bacterium]|nr:glycosyltransferase family 2 protein [Syntrophorhabdales bacterium]
MRKNELPSIGVLILNRNGREWLSPLYDSLLAQDYKNARLYLVDNASEDDSVELTLEHYPAVKVIRMPRNLGYCMAYNLSMPYAFADGCEWVIWANNDILLEPGCLEQLATTAKGDLRIGVIGPAFLEWESEKPNAYMHGNHPAAITAMQQFSREPIDVEWVEGSFLMASRACIESVGPLDPYLFFYWEETDFCRRARYKGWRVVLAPAAIARHHAGGWSQDNEDNKQTANRLQSRNYYIYKLADPFASFSRNILNSLHLLLVHIKQCLPKNPSLTLFHFQVFASIIWELRTVHRKWVRDRLKEHPPKLPEGVLPVEVEIIQGTTRGCLGVKA